MPNDEDILQVIESQREKAQKQVRKKALQVTSSAEEEDDGEEELEARVPTQKTITVGEKQIPMGSTLGPEPVRKIKVKFTTQRTREEEIEQIKEEISKKQPPKRVCV